VRIRPGGHPEVKPFTRALMQDGIPFTMFAADDVQAEYERQPDRDRTVSMTKARAGIGNLRVRDRRRSAMLVTC
jgi:hypothetical protein